MIIRYLFSSNQPFYPLSLCFPHTFSFPSCLNPSLFLPFVLSPFIPYCVLCNLCICSIHPGSITPSGSRTLHACLIMMGFTPAKWGWDLLGQPWEGPEQDRPLSGSILVSCLPLCIYVPLNFWRQDWYGLMFPLMDLRAARVRIFLGVQMGFYYLI